MSDTLPTGPDTTRNEAVPLPQGTGTHETEVGGRMVSPYHQEGQSVPSLDPLQNCPPWSRLLLFRVWRGVPLDDARTMEGSKVSTYMVRQLGIQHPTWRALLDEAQQGALMDCPVLPADVTRAFAMDEELERHGHAMSGSLKHAHHYIRMGMEAQGRIGAASQVLGAGITAPLSGAQVTLLVQGMTPQQLAETLRALTQAPVPTQVVEVQEPPRGAGASKKAGGL